MANSTSSETAFWLLRHPEPEASSSGLCYGSLDVKLSEAGIVQAQHTARTLANVPLAAIYTSPRQRCFEAARILAASQSCPLETIESLREMDFGAFEGRSYSEIERDYPETYRQWMEHPTQVQFPGGESYRDVQVRVRAIMGKLRIKHTGQAIAIVSHGGVIRTILAESLDLAPAHIFRLGLRYAGISLVREIDGVPIVDLVNATDSPAW